MILMFERRVCANPFRLPRLQKNFQRKGDATVSGLAALLQQFQCFARLRRLRKDEDLLHGQRHLYFETCGQFHRGELAFLLEREDRARR